MENKGYRKGAHGALALVASGARSRAALREIGRIAANEENGNIGELLLDIRKRATAGLHVDPRLTGYAEANAALVGLMVKQDMAMNRISHDIADNFVDPDDAHANAILDAVARTIDDAVDGCVLGQVGWAVAALYCALAIMGDRAANSARTGEPFAVEADEARSLSEILVAFNDARLADLGRDPHGNPAVQMRGPLEQLLAALTTATVVGGGMDAAAVSVMHGQVVAALLALRKGPA